MNEKKPNPLELPPPPRGFRAFSGALFFLAGCALTALIAFGFFGVGSRESHRPPTGTGQHEAAASVYYCPMHPEVVQGEPGSCPVCRMDLVQRDQPGHQDHDHGHGASADSATIRIDPVQVQNIGVVSEPAEIRDIARQSRTVGVLDYNTELVTWINTRVEGWIEKAHVTYVGESIEAGSPLFEIYSPELVTTQEEYLRALDYRATLADSADPEVVAQADKLVRASRQRLVYWDIDGEQIAELERDRTVKRRLTVRSPAAGVVVEIMGEALEGLFVRPGMKLYRIADLSSVWVHADIYEPDIPWIEEGSTVRVAFRSSGQELDGRVLFLYPELSRETRTLRVCIEVDNRGGRLRPGMFADVVLEGPTIPGATVIPESAVLRSGERELVFVDEGEGRFTSRSVRLGAAVDDDVQVLDGLVAGERVVTQAQFLLDSESRLQEAIAKFLQRPGHGAHAP